VIPEFHAEVNAGSDVTFAVHVSTFAAGSLLDLFSELSKDLGSTQRGKGSLNPDTPAMVTSQ